MGGVCSKRSTVNSSSNLHSGEVNESDQQSDNFNAKGNRSPLRKILPKVPPARIDDISKETEFNDGRRSFEAEDLDKENSEGDKKKLARALSERARTARSRTSLVAKKGASKVNEVSSIFGRAGFAAVEALDTIGSSMTNLNLGSGFASGAVSKGNKIEILAFEVANTIVKGYNLKLSLSEENIRVLKKEILLSEGVQRLVSTDIGELLQIAAVDKRNELKIFSGEVVRFGNHCRDPQWHQLGRFFEKLDTEPNVFRQTKEEAEVEMENLMTLAQHTAELYRELHALDRFELDYRRKLQEEEVFNNSQRGDNLSLLRSDLKSQKRHVKNLKKKSLWWKVLEEVIDKLVDAVYFLHHEIDHIFKDAEAISFSKREIARVGTSQRLGAAGLSLHYANIISQIDSLVSRPGSVLPNTRDNLYQSLPPNMRLSLRTTLQNPSFREESLVQLTVAQIKGKMENILSWLVPVATNTTKVHHGFGWVGEWANSGSALDPRQQGHADLTLLQTLHHAQQTDTESYILELIVLLHYLVILARSTVSGNKSPVTSQTRSPKQLKNSPPHTQNSVEIENGQHVPVSPVLSPEDHEMLKYLKDKKLTPGLSKSQEFDSSRSKTANRSNRLSKSNSHSPTTSTEGDLSLPRCHVTKGDPTNFEIDRVKALDVMDRVDDI